MANAGKAPLLDLAGQLAFYGAYHNNKWNQLIHFFFVPLITWSTLVWAVQLPLASLHMSEARTVEADLGTLALLCLSLFYFALDAPAGMSWAVCCGGPMLMSAKSFSEVDNSGWYALGAFVLGWYMQIHPGHMLLEGRRPALMDSLVQSLTMANLFVWMELLFLLGYRPSLRQQVQAAVDGDIKAWKAKRQE